MMSISQKNKDRHSKDNGDQYWCKINLQTNSVYLRLQLNNSAEQEPFWEDDSSSAD
jgi:hypothetical protein